MDVLKEEYCSYKVYVWVLTTRFNHILSFIVRYVLSTTDDA